MLHPSEATWCMARTRRCSSGAAAAGSCAAAARGTGRRSAARPPGRAAAPRAPARRGKVREVRQAETGRTGGVHHLHGLSVHLAEDGAERLVPPDHFGDRAPEDRRVQRPAEPQRQGDVVGAAAAVQPVDEPEPLLRERERQRRAVARHRHDRRRRRVRSVLDQRRHVPAQSGDGGRFEEGPDGDLHLESLSQARRQTGREERVPAHLEEVVVDPHPLPPQHLRPRPAQDVLQRGTGRDVPRLPLASVPFRRRQRPAIDLAVGGAGKRSPPPRKRPVPCAPASSAAGATAAPPPPPRRPRTPRAACRRARPREPPPPPRARPRGTAGRPRSRPARCGSRGS